MNKKLTLTEEGLVQLTDTFFCQKWLALGVNGFMICTSIQVYKSNKSLGVKGYFLKIEIFIFKTKVSNSSHSQSDEMIKYAAAAVAHACTYACTLGHHDTTPEF